LTRRANKNFHFCNVNSKDVISAPDAASIYEVPLNFADDHLGERILLKLKIKPKKRNLEDWEKFVDTIRSSVDPVKIGIVGKYFESGKFTLIDSYISVIEAVKHAAWFSKKSRRSFGYPPKNYEKDAKNLKELDEYDGIIVPGGFGNRGIEGKIMAIEYCRKNNVPFLGLCLGMQLANPKRYLTGMIS